MTDYIQELIVKNRRLEAIRFIYEFELVDQFPPVPLLKGHAKYAKKVAKEIRKKGKNSFEAQVLLSHVTFSCCSSRL